MNGPDHVEVDGQDVEDDDNVVGADNFEDDVVGPYNVEDDGNVVGVDNVEDNVVGDDNVEDNMVGDDNVEDDGEMSVNEDYVASEFSDEDSDFTFSAESEEDFDWTKVLSPDLGECSNGNKVHVNEGREESKDSDYLFTPPKTDDDEVVKYPTHKSGVGTKFHLEMMFTNKEMIREAIKDCGMENQKNVFIKKNDSKRIVIKCMVGCNFYVRFSKSNGHQY